MSKNLVEPERQNYVIIWRMLDKQGYTRACTRPRAPIPTHTPIQTQIYNTYCFSTAKVIRERASVLRHTQIACLV
jgi:hypothetical protein